MRRPIETAICLSMLAAYSFAGDDTSALTPLQRLEMQHAKDVADRSAREAKLQEQIDDARVAQEERDKKAEEERLKRPKCCRIGMTSEQVKNSQMGPPDEVHRTITANHVREQWVYTDRGYLYFEDGKLRSIQD